MQPESDAARASDGAFAEPAAAAPSDAGPHPELILTTAEKIYAASRTPGILTAPQPGAAEGGPDKAAADKDSPALESALARIRVLENELGKAAAGAVHEAPLAVPVPKRVTIGGVSEYRDSDTYDVRSCLQDPEDDLSSGGGSDDGQHAPASVRAVSRSANFVTYSVFAKRVPPPKAYDSDSDMSLSSGSTLDLPKVNDEDEEGAVAEAPVSDDDNDEPRFRFRPDGLPDKSHTRSRSRKSKSYRSNTSSCRPGELSTVMPESELLDMHRLDINKVVGVQHYYSGNNVPSYLSLAFDEGLGIDPQEVEPLDPRADLAPVGKVTAVFTNHSRKKDSADIIRYAIYVVRKEGPCIFDASTDIYLEDGRMLGKIACILGKVDDPYYVVQDMVTEVEDEDIEDEIEMEPRTPVGSLVYTAPARAKLLFKDEGATCEDNVKDYFEKRYHQPGCDASHFEDEELPLEHQEFSDDEKERAARKEKKRKRLAGPNEAANVGLLDTVDSSSSDESYEFNDEGEVVDVVRQAGKRKRGGRVAKVVTASQPDPFGCQPSFMAALNIPPPPPLIKGDPRKVFVSEVPSTVLWHQLAAIMGAAFGSVEEAVIKTKSKKKLRGMSEDVAAQQDHFAFVLFQEEKSARQAVFIGKIYSPNGQLMRIRESRPDKLRRRVEFSNARTPCLPPRESPEVAPVAEAEHEDLDLDELEL